MAWGSTSTCGVKGARMTVDRYARIVGALWLVSIVGGIYGFLLAHGTHLGQDAILIGGGAYVAVSALLYELFRPVNPSLSLLAAFSGLMAVIGFTGSGDSSFYGGLQCVLLGYLILKSSFLPRPVGALIAFAGLGQLIILSTLLPPSVAKPLAPIGYISDGIGEGAMALWLVVMGVSRLQWEKAAKRERASGYLIVDDEKRDQTAGG